MKAANDPTKVKTKYKLGKVSLFRRKIAAIQTFYLTVTGVVILQEVKKKLSETSSRLFKKTI